MPNRIRSAFCVLANPEQIITYQHNPDGSFVLDDNKNKVILKSEPNPDTDGMNEEEICKHYLNMWVTSGKSRTGAVLFCESADGFRHLHAVFESKNGFTFSALKKVFPKMHIEPTQGTKDDVEDYIHKTGKFEEKGEKVLASAQVGEIIGKQGARTDLISLDEVKEMIFEQNKRPSEIFFEHPQALKQQKAVEWLFWYKRKTETPLQRELHVTWLCGQTGTGKSHIQLELYDKYGEDNFYLVNDYINPFDNYQGEDCILIDEFRGQFRLADMLMYLQGYRQQLRARYSNKYSLWTKVYITSPVTPYELYRKADETTGSNDKLQQLYRRIDDILYCFKLTDDKNTYYCRQRFSCALDASPEQMYNQFYSVKNHFERLIKIYHSPPVATDDLYVSAVPLPPSDPAELTDEQIKNGVPI